MASSRDDILVRLKMLGARSFNRDADESARSLDNLGDQASQAARKMAEMSAAGQAARVNIGPISTSARFGLISLGALTLATERYTGSILGFVEATATVGAGGAAAGGVWLTGAIQGAATLTLGLKDLRDALGGNADALNRLGPEALDAFMQIESARQSLAQTAQEGLLPGVSGGIDAALRNLPVFNKVVGDTATELGRLATAGGEMVGSKAWGKDLAKMGATNTRIIGNLGDGALHLADAARHILVEAGPLAEWLSEVADNGAKFLDKFLGDKRRTGELAQFFRDARRDITLLGQATGNLAGGVINLFGASDVDGTRTLNNFVALTDKFEAWTATPNVQIGGVGQALIDEIPNLADDFAVAFANMLGDAAPQVAGLFWDSFWQASADGKFIIGAGILWKAGAFGALGRKLASTIGGLLGGAAGGPVEKALKARGATPANPLFVSVVGGLPGGPPGPKPPTPVGGGPLGWLKSFPWLAAGAAGGVAGVGIEAGHLIDDKLLHGGATAFNKATHTGTGIIDPVKGLIDWFDRKDRAAGTGGTGAPGIARLSEQPPINLELHNNLNVDGRTIGQVTTRQQIKRASRKRSIRQDASGHIRGIGN